MRQSACRNVWLVSKSDDGRTCAHPSRSQHGYPPLGTRIKPATWRGAGSSATTQTDLVLAILTSGEPNMSIWKAG
jgi:hypothetical protein